MLLHREELNGMVRDYADAMLESWMKPCMRLVMKADTDGLR
jgi:hypothetical protein